MIGGALLELRQRQRAIFIFRYQRRNRCLAAFGGVGDVALDIALDKEGQQIGVAAADSRVGREGDQRPIGAARDAAGLAHILREHRTKNNLRAFAQRSLRRRRRACGRRLIVLDENGDVARAAVGIGELGGVAQRGADGGLTGAAGQRNDQTDFGRARANGFIDLLGRRASLLSAAAQSGGAAHRITGRKGQNRGASRKSRCGAENRHRENNSRDQVILICLPVIKGR